MDKLTNLQKNIIKTICYFDIFNIPVSYKKLKIFLYQCKIDNIFLFNKALIDLQEKKIINKIDDYYILRGRDRIVKLRKIRKKFCLLRWKRAQKAARILQIIPFIKLVAVTNSLAINNSNKNSDIDLIIIAKKNRLWIARALSVLVLDLFKLNKNKKKIANQICLGFFVDETKLDFSIFTDSNNDIYYHYKIAHITPILDRKIFNRFIKANRWIYKKLPNFKKNKQLFADYSIKKQKIFLMFAKITEFILAGSFGQYIENKIKIIQQYRIKKLEKDKLPFIIINDSIMRLRAYNKSKKYNNLLKQSYQRFFNE